MVSIPTPTPVSGTAHVTSTRGPIVVLDADPAVRRVVCLVLEGAGFVCIAAESVDVACDLISRHHPSLVLADLQATGSEEAALRQVVEVEGWRPRVALMSAYPRSRRGEEDFFIRKPIEFDRLLDLLDAIERGRAG